MKSLYPKGSEWRKWDLHIHTPKSIIQSYGGDTPEAWDAFVKKLASLLSEIKVIGITDYLFCDGYEYLLTRRAEFPNIELMIPNIEFRLNTFSGTEKNTHKHNFHVLFDPSVSVDDIREQLLGSLSSGYRIQDKAEWEQTPTVRSLKELGRQIKSAAPAENTVQNKNDLQVGFDNITYKREDIEKLLKKNCFKGKNITAIGYSEWNQSRWDQSAAEKRTLINVANFSLTCVDDPLKISEHHDDLERNKLNSLILHSSDAHELGRIGETQLWIKADPTFAGLKQVLNEPKARVFIGESPPNFKPDHQVIQRISIPKSNGWFPEGFTLDLNRDLITIIGGRGSGKSAIAEAIAYGAGSKDDTDDAFLKKAAKHKHPITGTKIILNWADGHHTEFVVGDLTQDHEQVRFLPQGAVEDLCSHKNSEKLQKQIENVIFQALGDTERMGSSDFDELKFHILSEFQFEKDQVVKRIREINSKVSYHHSLLHGLPEKEKQLEDKNNELEKLKKSLPELPAEDKADQEKLAKLAGLKKKFETRIVDLQGKLSSVVEIETKVKIFKATAKEYREEIGVILKDLNIEEIAVFDVTVNSDGIERVLNQKKATISEHVKILKEGGKEEVANILSVPDSELPFNNLLALNTGIDLKEKETRAYETIKLKYQQQKKTIRDVESSISALKTEIEHIKAESASERDRYEKERLDTYFRYFDLLRAEKLKMEELYKPLQDSLSKGSETDEKLVFTAKNNYQLDSHNESGLDIIDRTRKGNFREIESLTKALNNLWDVYVRSDFEETGLEDGLKTILKEFTVFEDEEILIESQLRDNSSIEDFYNWLFDPTHFDIISSLTFDDTDLYLLSPGQKGIILMMLYLEIDKADYRPMIIDQPEANLDNLSVYLDLIEYFRGRKEYRQIIMVTHNPNLVVNTDAEQIIVANYKGRRIPRLEYCSGSLEDQARKIPDVDVAELEDGIIEQVCDILEGGEVAFTKRKKKYQISRKSQI